MDKPLFGMNGHGIAHTKQSYPPKIRTCVDVCLHWVRQLKDGAAGVFTGRS